MNFLDAYDVASPGTPTGVQSEQTLNEEVTQVVGQLSRFWGGFRKQSQTVLESARKDLGQVVSQAQKELVKLTSDVPSSSSAPPEGVAEADETSHETRAEPATDDSTADIDRTDADTTPPSNAGGHTRSTSNLFARLQASLPPNLVATVQNQLPEPLKHGPSSIDFTQLRTTLTTEFQRVQGVTRAQAEEYVHKSESLLREAGEYLKDAVKVLPPEESASTPNFMWDGTDVWMLPDTGTPGGSSKGKERERDSDSSSSRRQSGEGLRAVATRAEAMLKQLRHDPEVIKVDPEADERARELYVEWVQAEVSSKEGGIEGEEWSAAVKDALGDSVDGQALQATFDTLVPAHMTSEIFWTRYFFRVHQVEREEERRKALIQGTTENDEDFSWEDDDEEPTSPTGNRAGTKSKSAAVDPNIVLHQADTDSTTDQMSSSVSGETVMLAPKSAPSTPGGLSPRLSSEDSFDVVSSQVSNNGESKPETTEKKPEEDGDEPDSDWE